MLKYVLAIATVLLMPTVAMADLPRFDVEGHCQEVAEFGGSSNMIYNSCIQMEQSAYNGMKASWSTVPAQTQDYCLEVARFGGASYQMLQSCVQMETSAAQNKEAFSFE